MRIADFLSPDHVLAEVPAVDKAFLLRQLSGRAAIATRLPSNEIARLVLKREALGSTGMGSGIAIPHARIPGLAKPFGMLARLKAPIAFEAIDRRPVDLVFLLLFPIAATGDQHLAIASLARRLRDPAVAAGMRSAGDASAIYGALVADAHEHA